MYAITINYSGVLVRWSWRYWRTSTPVITAAYQYECVSMLIITLTYQYASYYRGVLVRYCHDAIGLLVRLYVITAAC